MRKTAGVLKEIFTPKGLFFPLFLMFLVPVLMWLAFPSSSDRTIRLYGSIWIATFVWASHIVRFFLPPLGQIVITKTAEDLGPVVALDTVLFIIFGVVICAVLRARGSVSKRRAIWLVIIWGAFLVQMMGAVLMSIVAFAGD
jgi:hypothetical protein